MSLPDALSAPRKPSTVYRHLPGEDQLQIDIEPPAAPFSEHEPAPGLLHTGEHQCADSAVGPSVVAQRVHSAPDGLVSWLR